MTWKHVACVIGALALPVICGLSSVCGHEALKEIITLSVLVVGAIMGHARSEAETTQKAVKPPESAS